MTPIIGGGALTDGTVWMIGRNCHFNFESNWFSSIIREQWQTAHLCRLSKEPRIFGSPFPIPHRSFPWPGSTRQPFKDSHGFSQATTPELNKVKNKVRNVRAGWLHCVKWWLQYMKVLLMRELLLTQSSELVRQDCPDQMALFLAAGDPITQSIEALEAANNLISPVMDYIREVKGNLLMTAVLTVQKTQRLKQLLGL